MTKCDLESCEQESTYKATFRDKKTNEISYAYYCNTHRNESYDLRGLGMTVRLIKIHNPRKNVVDGNDQNIHRGPDKGTTDDTQNACQDSRN